jgi:hypothetical protein
MSSPLQMKQAVTAALEAEDYEKILTLAYQSRKILSVLIRLAYEKETLTGWRAISAIGKVASVFVRSNYDFLREMIRKLLWSLSDESGGIGWAAPEILGEIVRADPEKMSDIIPLITEVYYIEEKVFRPGVLYALKRIAETSSGSIVPFQHVIMDGLCEQEPLARLYALELVGLLNSHILPENRESVRDSIKVLLQDRSEVWIFKNGMFEDVVVGDYAKEIQDRCFSHAVD